MEDKSSQFWALIAHYERILLATHQQADLDAVASVLALKFLICHKFPSKNLNVFFNGLKGYAASFLKELNIIDKQPLPQPGDIDLCILMDGNNFSRIGNGDFFDKYAGARIIIDHHAPPNELHQNVIFRHIDPTRPSCVEVLYDLREEGQTFPLEIRRLLVAGIFSDSKNLTLCDSKSFVILSDFLGSDLKLGDVTHLFQEETPYSEKIARLKGAQRGNILQIGSWIVTTSNVSSFEAQVANGLFALGADIALVVSNQKTGNSRIIGRASSAILRTGKINFGELFHSLQGAEIESAGGHLGAAGVSFTGNPDEILKEILKRIHSVLSENPDKC